MDPYLDSHISYARRRLQGKERRAFAVILAENAAKALWRPVCWTLFFFGLWLLGLPALFGQGFEIGAAIVFLLGLGVLLRRDFRHFKLPERVEIWRRIETDSGLAHRPFSSIEDRLSNPSTSKTRTLWELRAQKFHGAIEKARINAPRAHLTRKDPYALRYFCALLFICGLIVAGPYWSSALSGGLLPIRGDMFQFEEAFPPNVVFRITPPEYTGLAETVIQGSLTQEPLEIPEGANVKILVSGGLGDPVLRVNDERTPFKQVDENNYSLAFEIRPAEKLSVRQGLIRNTVLAYKYVEDTVPELALNGETEFLSQGRFQIPFKVRDDFGVRDLELVMTLDPEAGEPPRGRPVTDRRLIMSPAGEETETSPVYDLARHTWAGLPVILSFTAYDAVKQASETVTVKMTLPERQFSHPTAQLLIEMRKRLVWNGYAAQKEIIEGLEALLNTPESLNDDPIAFLSARVAASRLRYQQNEASLLSVIELLWDTAMRLDGGSLEMALRTLEDAQRNVEKTLADPDATDAEIAQAMQELQQALAQYFQEMAREMQKRAESGDPLPFIPPTEGMRELDLSALSSFLDKLRAEALSGNRESALEMLSQIQRMTEMLDPSAIGKLPEDVQFMQEGINELQELIEKQQALLEKSRSQAEAAQRSQLQKYPEWWAPDTNAPRLLQPDSALPPPSPDTESQNTINTQGSYTEQESLRLILGQLMREAGEKMKEAPENMGLAEQEMRGSSAMLKGNNPGGAIPHQEKAIAHLQDAMEDMNQQMMARMRQMTLLSLGGASLDPLGRPRGSDGDGEPDNGRDIFGTVEIPEEHERKRIEEIMKILRERSGDFSRPEIELEYLRRLLRQF